MTARLRVTYELSCRPGEDPLAKARGMALEQTAELPPEALPRGLSGSTVGRVEGLERRGARRWRAVISYRAELAGGEIGQLLNLLFGNLSLQRGVRAVGVEWPAALLAAFPGPRFGIPGLRRLCGVPDRPLLATVLKPVGLSSQGLARLAGRFAAAGIDIVKDDHSLADQAAAPFRERLARCQEAVEEANRRSGRRALYFPHLVGGPGRLEERMEAARQAGCRGALVSPLPLGLPAVAWLAEKSGLALLGHPTLAGVFFSSPSRGLAPELLLGDLFRIAGCDGAIFPPGGSRFALSDRAGRRIAGALRRPLAGVRPALPVVGGGLDAGRVPGWIERYGPDTAFIVAGSLYAGGDPATAARALVERVEAAVRS